MNRHSLNIFKIKLSVGISSEGAIGEDVQISYSSAFGGPRVAGPHSCSRVLGSSGNVSVERVVIVPQYAGQKLFVVLAN